MSASEDAGYIVSVRGTHEGVSLDDAISKVSARMPGSRQQLREVLTTDGYILKKDLTKAQADNYVSFLEGCGVRAETMEHRILDVDLPLDRLTPPPLPRSLVPPRLPGRSGDDLLVRRLTDYEKISGALWVAIGIFQCLTVLGIIAGIWNVFAGWTRFKMSKRIFARDATVPADFEPIGGLIVIGIINLILGGVIGLVFVAFDFFIRDKVLSNAQVFTAGGAARLTLSDLTMGDVRVAD